MEKVGWCDAGATKQARMSPKQQLTTQRGRQLTVKHFNCHTEEVEFLIK